MARDSSGNYSLPSGNPVVTNTTIDSTVHNNTTSDIASELTDSLSRSGKGGMLAVFKLLDGSVSSPGAQFANDANVGMYRVTTDTLGLAAGGVLVVKGEAETVTIPVKLVVESAEAVDLTASTAAFVIGALTGQHIEFDDAELQSKSDATTAATLSLNRLGGAVNIGPQSGSGAVTLYFGGDQSLITIENGIAVKDGDSSTPTVNLVNSSGTTVGSLLYSSGVYLQSLVNSASVNIQAKDSAGNTDSIFVATADGGISLYYAGVVGSQITNVGQIITSTANDNPIIEMYRSDKSTRNGYVHFATSALNIVQEVHGAPVNIIAEDAGGTQRTLIEGDPDNDLGLYYAGTKVAETTVNGMQVGSGANLSPTSGGVGHLTLSGSGYAGYATLDATAMYVGHNSSSRNLVLQADETDMLTIAPAGAITLKYGASNALATAAIATNSTGATVTDGGGTARPVGFNIMPITTDPTDLRIATVGHLIRKTTTAALDIDTTTDTAPDGSTWAIENSAGGNFSLTATGVNLLWLDGSSGTTGGRTVANYAFITVIKVSNGNYRVVGTGLS